MSFFVGKLILIAGFIYACSQTECKQSHGFVIRPAIDFFNEPATTAATRFETAKANRRWKIFSRCSWASRKVPADKQMPVAVCKAMRRPDLTFSLTCAFAAAAEETLQGGPVASRQSVN